MARIKADGMDLFVKQIENCAAKVSEVNKEALGEGAAYVADAVKSALEAMPTYVTDGGNRKYGATASEKEQIISNFGIAHFKGTSGGWQTSIGFTGYVDYPSGRRVATGMLMQAIDQGTSFRRATHTVSATLKGIKDGCIQAMQKVIDTRTQEIFNE